MQTICIYYSISQLENCQEEYRGNPNVWTHCFCISNIRCSILSWMSFKETRETAEYKSTVPQVPQFICEPDNKTAQDYFKRQKRHTAHKSAAYLFLLTIYNRSL